MSTTTYCQLWGWVVFQAQISKLGMLFGHETQVEAVISIVVYETQFFFEVSKNFKHM
jgi:hypothetical protein